jgi:hypothetical protein
MEKLVGTRFPLRVTSNLGPCCILGLSITLLIRCIIDSPFPLTFLLFRRRVNEPFDYDHHR